VLAVAAYGAPATVHNLTVADTHTFYVVAAGQPVLSHNCGGGADPNKSPWPPNHGFEGPSVKVNLPKGTKIDRYGGEGGRYASPEGTPFEMRALPKSAKKGEYHVYEVVEEFEAEVGMVAPWFGYPGGGMQVFLPASVRDLIARGLLREVK